MEAQVLDTIQYLCGLLVGEGPVEGSGEIFQGVTVHQDVLESDPLR